ncbi:MAG: hypothetical protein OXH39_01545, partial [Candidatus Poribacteria bacterium]|nr:hypothetical protein [Candidatus Poribacteria bacterium]
GLSGDSSRVEKRRQTLNSPTLYTIRLERQAERELRKLPRDVVQRINAALERLIHEPRPQGVVKLTGQTGSKWRIRIREERNSSLTRNLTLRYIRHCVRQKVYFTKRSGHSSST